MSPKLYFDWVISTGQNSYIRIIPKKQPAEEAAVHYGYSMEDIPESAEVLSLAEEISKADQ